jgi:hypothetical protein
MKSKHHLKIAILLAAVTCLGCSDETKKEGQGIEENQGVEDGYDSPQHLVEAMKGEMFELQIPLYPPADRYMMAYMSVEMLRGFVAMAEDPDQRKEAEQAFTALIKKYDLADRLEFTDNEDKEEALAKKAFEGVDLIALYADVESFMAAPYSGFFSDSDGETDEVEALSLKNLKIDGGDATGTVLFSDDTEIPVVFVRSVGRWYLSMRGMKELQLNTSWSTEITLKITFATDGDLEGATAKSLLKDVNYDRSMEATLRKTAEDRVAYLTVMMSTDPNSDVDSESILEQVGKAPGVEAVEPSFDPESDPESDDESGIDLSAMLGSEMDAELEEAMKRALSNLGDPNSTIECTLKITFATDDDLEGATAKSLLKGVFDERTMEATLNKKAKGRMADLALSIPMDADMESILEHLGKAPGVEDVELSLGAELEEALKGLAENEEDPEVEESPTAETTPDNAAEEAPGDMIAERVWTDLRNRKLTAALISLDAGIGKFRRNDGKFYDWPVEKFSAADRKLIEEASREREAKVSP